MHTGTPCRGPCNFFVAANSLSSSLARCLAGSNITRIIKYRCYFHTSRKIYGYLPWGSLFWNVQMQHERYKLLEPLKLSIHHSQCVSRFQKLEYKITQNSSWFAMSICELANEPVAFRKACWASDASRTSARVTVRWRRFSSTMSLLEAEKGHICGIVRDILYLHQIL